MLKVRTIFILGIWVAILPYLGFPKSIKNIIFSLSGLALIYISFVFYKEIRAFRRHKQKDEKKFDNFFENEFLKNNESKHHLNIETKSNTTSYEVETNSFEEKLNNLTNNESNEFLKINEEIIISNFDDPIPTASPYINTEDRVAEVSTAGLPKTVRRGRKPKI